MRPHRVHDWIIVIAAVMALFGCAGCEEMAGRMTGNWGACTHLSGGCTEHNYEHECYDAGGVKWWDGYRC